MSLTVVEVVAAEAMFLLAVLLETSMGGVHIKDHGHAWRASQVDHGSIGTLHITHLFYVTGKGNAMAISFTGFF